MPSAAGRRRLATASTGLLVPERATAHRVHEAPHQIEVPALLDLEHEASPGAQHARHLAERTRVVRMKLSVLPEQFARSNHPAGKGMSSALATQNCARLPVAASFSRARATRSPAMSIPTVW